MNSNKIFKNLEEFKPIITSIRKTKKSIVFTNGCFDILHVGHLDYLKKASLLGNILIVGLNSDNSIKRLKGNERPIIDFFDRSLFLSFFDFIDYIVGFDEDTPYELIKEIKPEVLAKGGDYTIDNIIGADIVRNNGGRVEIIEFEYNRSTTKLIEKIRGNL